MNSQEFLTRFPRHPYTQVAEHEQTLQVVKRDREEAMAVVREEHAEVLSKQVAEHDKAHQAAHTEHEASLVGVLS